MAFNARRGLGPLPVSTEMPWHVLDRETLFAAPPFVSVASERVRTAGGVVIDDFYRVELVTFALCVPQLAGGEIVTLWEYKHGPGRFGLGFPAGHVEPDEAPDLAARRELLEETGYAASDLRSLGSYVDNGNQRGSMGHYFFTHDCRRVAVPMQDETEQAEIRLMYPQAIDEALAQGQFSVIHHVAAWALARPHLR